MSARPADMFKCSSFGLSEGPLEYRATSVGGPWSVVAEELRLPSGARPFDVRLEAADGSRVPAGPNFQDKPDAEVTRLLAMLAWPALAAVKGAHQ